MYTYLAICENIVDGDTGDFLIFLGFDITIKLRLRFYGINAYECRRVKSQTEEENKLGKEGKKWLKALLEGEKVVVKTHKKGKFGRYLADIYVGDEHINKLLVDMGYAKVNYYGDKPDEKG